MSTHAAPRAIPPGPVDPAPTRLTRLVLPWAPVVTIALLAALLLVLLWIIERDERDQRRADQIKDALAVEQALRFQIDSTLGMLEQIAADFAKGEAAAGTARIALLLRGGREIERLSRRGLDGAPIQIWPPALAGSAWDGADVTAALRIASATGHALFTGPRPLPGTGTASEGDGGVTGLAVILPIFVADAPAGALVAEIALPRLLAQHVPWWVAQTYQVTLTDSDGATLATRTPRQPDDPSLAHVIAFDLPGQGLMLAVTPFRVTTDLRQNTLVGAIILLALLTAGSLAATHLHIRRRLAAEGALRAESAFRRAMEDSLTVGMRARDRDGRIIYVNPAFCRMVGWPADDLVGRTPPMPYWHPDAIQATQAIHQQVLAGEAPAGGFEIRFQHRDGHPLDALIYEAPLIDAEGRHIGWMATVLDITERKAAQELARVQGEKMQRAARLVTMGEMASTLAHELNQPLAAIASYAAGCRNRLAMGDAGPELEDALGKLHLQAQRAGQILRRIRDFVRARDPHFEAVDPAALVTDTLAFIAGEAQRQGVGVETEIADTLPPLHADPILLQQVLLNLIRNGFEAMAAQPATARRMVVRVTAPADQVVFSIADTGPGIAPDRAETLFTPFVTAKPEGMGIGLNICRTIVERHRGRLSFTANLGQAAIAGAAGGTVFTVALPAARGSA